MTNCFFATAMNNEESLRSLGKLLSKNKQWMAAVYGTVWFVIKGLHEPSREYKTV